MSNIKLRNFQTSDIPTITRLINTTFEADGRPDRVSDEMLEFQLTLPFIHPDEDFFVATDEHDHIVGIALGALNPRTGGIGGFWLVDRAYRGQSLERDLLEKSDNRMLERSYQVITDDRPVYVTRQMFDTQQGGIAVLEKFGYEEIRCFYEMVIELDDVIDAPVFPPNVELRPFDRKQHARAVHAAQQESFRDHWGHHEDTPFEEWEKRFDEPHYDPLLYLIAWDGDEVAGLSQCQLQEGETDMGSVNILGVRRNWRKQGLGMALLRHSFYVFQQRGLKRTGLGVDSSSKTNAVALYERAGMHIRRRALAYRKVLRGNAADIID